VHLGPRRSSGMEESPGSGTVRLNCQQCDQPVTFTDLTKLSLASHKAGQPGARLPRSQSRAFKHAPLPPCHRPARQGVRDRAGSANAMMGSYVDVRDAPGQLSARGSGAKASGAFEAMTRIFETAASGTHVDHPLCAKCLDHVAKALQERTAAAEARARAYQGALASIQVSMPPPNATPSPWSRGTAGAFAGCLHGRAARGDGKITG
jgi:hypothetical protein